VSSYHDCPYHHRITNQEGNIMTTSTLTRRKPTADDLKVGLVLHGDRFSTSFDRVELVGKYGARSWRCVATTHSGEKRNPFIYNSTLLQGRYYMDVPEPTLDERIAELERELAAIKAERESAELLRRSTIDGWTGGDFESGDVLRITARFKTNPSGKRYVWLCRKQLNGLWSSTGGLGSTSRAFRDLAEFFADNCDVISVERAQGWTTLVGK
jgi:hypothetical protein